MQVYMYCARCQIKSVDKNTVWNTLFENFSGNFKFILGNMERFS